MFEDDSDDDPANSSRLLEKEDSSETDQGSESSRGLENSGSSYDSDTDAEYTLRRSTRNKRPPARYSPSANYLLLSENGESESYHEALKVK